MHKVSLYKNNSNLTGYQYVVSCVCNFIARMGDAGSAVHTGEQHLIQHGQEVPKDFKFPDETPHVPDPLGDDQLHKNDVKVIAPIAPVTLVAPVMPVVPPPVLAPIGTGQAPKPSIFAKPETPKV